MSHYEVKSPIHALILSLFLTLESPNVYGANQSTAPAQTNRSTVSQVCSGSDYSTDRQCHAGDLDCTMIANADNPQCQIQNLIINSADFCKNYPAAAMCQTHVNCSQSQPCTVPLSNNTSSDAPPGLNLGSNKGLVKTPVQDPKSSSTTPSKTADTKTGTDTTKKDPADSDPTNTQAQSPSSNGSPASSGDSAACVSAHSAADSACGSLPASSYSSNAIGINDSSQAYQAAMQNAANANYTWINQCVSASNNCRNVCQTVDPSAASACAAYSSKVQQVAQQTQQNINDYQAASAAQQASVTSPSSLANQQINPNAPGCANDPTGPLCQTCSADPSNQACQPQPQGNVGFKGDGLDGSTGSASFAIPDPGTLMQQAAYQQNPYAQQQAMAGVPQGGGGGIGAGANGAGAKLGDARRGGGSAPVGDRADIMQGERGGGFAGYGAGPQNTDEFSNRGRYNTRNARRPAGARGDGGYLGMDLKRYLPGGMFDPGRQVGGMFRRSNSEIMGQTADLFRHISDRMQERCRLGLLYDCR